MAALGIAASPRTPAPAAERFLAWILLLPIGVTGLWAGVTHVFFPATAAAHIGWQVSPFQFEVGMADLAIGITAFISFWRELAFKAATVCAASVFLLGDAIGHIRQMVFGVGPGAGRVSRVGLTGWPGFWRKAHAETPIPQR